MNVQIKDTGIGIPPEQLSQIFDQFYQVDFSNPIEKTGTGIGLSLCKELVQLLGGTISVESKIDEGSLFTIHLPIQNQVPLVKGSSVEAMDTNPFTSIYDTIDDQDMAVLSDDQDEENPLILLIDDNKDVIQYLLAILGEQYQIETAVDGQQGIDKAIEIIPDVIICDVMMPVKNGYEVTDTLKLDNRTSHIPIILLTAKADQDSRIIGLQKGADEYLIKPFNEQELLLRLNNLAASRRKLQRYFQQKKALDLPSTELVQQEDAFLKNIREALEANIDEVDFGIVQICRAVGMSRTQIHRKIKALTGESTSIFLRRIRLDKGKELLETTDMNVSQAAYAVGFRDPGYFSRLYFEEFGERPSGTYK